MSSMNMRRTGSPLGRRASSPDLMVTSTGFGMPTFNTPNSVELNVGYGLHSEVLRSYFESARFADCVIIYGSKHFPKSIKVHRVVLCSQSAYFHRALDGKFREALIGHIRLYGDFPPAVECMMRFMYAGNYDGMLEKIRLMNPYFTAYDLDVHAYVMGDKYDVPALRAYAMNEYFARAHFLMAELLRPPHPRIQWTPPTFNGPFSEPRDPQEDVLCAMTDRLIDSFTLIWKRTSGYNDPLRYAALSFIKIHFSKFNLINYFAVLVLHHLEFRSDLERSFAEDGLEMRIDRNAQQSLVMQPAALRFAFAGFNGAVGPAMAMGGPSVVGWGLRKEGEDDVFVDEGAGGRMHLGNMRFFH